METRFGPSVEDSFGEIEGFSIIWQDRNTVGGGVLLYIRNNLKANVLFKSATTQVGKPRKPEYIFCTVWEGDSPPIFVAVVYRPTDVTFSSDPQFMNRLRSCCSEYRHKIIMDDWNVDMSNPSDPDYQSIWKLINGESLKLIETGPTHHTGVKDTWIDLLMVDHSDLVIESKRLPPPFESRHEIVILYIERFIPSLLLATIAYRKYSSVTSANFCTQLEHLWLDPIRLAGGAPKCWTRANATRWKFSNSFRQTGTNKNHHSQK